MFCRIESRIVDVNQAGGKALHRKWSFSKTTTKNDVNMRSIPPPIRTLPCCILGRHEYLEALCLFRKLTFCIYMFTIAFTSQNIFENVIKWIFKVLQLVESIIIIIIVRVICYEGTVCERPSEHTLRFTRTLLHCTHHRQKTQWTHGRKKTVPNCPKLYLIVMRTHQSPTIILCAWVHRRCIGCFFSGAVRCNRRVPNSSRFLVTLK